MLGEHHRLPHSLTETEESLRCVEPRRGLDSSNNIIDLDLRHVSSQLLETSDLELSTANAKACSLILGYGKQAAMLTELEKQQNNLEFRKETKVLSREDEEKTTTDASQLNAGHTCTQAAVVLSLRKYEKGNSYSINANLKDKKESREGIVSY